MNFVDGILSQTGNQQIREFYLLGEEGSNADPYSYKERAKNTQKQMTGRLREAYPHIAKYEEKTGPLFAYVGAV